MIEHSCSVHNTQTCSMRSGPIISDRRFLTEARLAERRAPSPRAAAIQTQCPQPNPAIPSCHLTYPSSFTILSLHSTPHLPIAPNATHPVTNPHTPSTVINHPFPIPSNAGSATTAPAKLHMFRTKLFSAIPLAARLGMNSVNIVFTSEKMSIEPIPKKKFAARGNATCTLKCAVQPYMISAVGQSIAAIHAFSFMRSMGWKIRLPASSYRFARRASRCMMWSIQRPPSREASR